ncbi:hypothetical protein [Carboxydothermus ferrireducens]|uniref:Small, acid-soluble spore protein, alpha/beta type n=1 Tax=Carboxydothermus ferrireducens DSM 11255 TaxID=1119529 RepID=A0ABX2RBA9_9THEO|nr:hypothetical protein [Carboxydothermus ferrireducens]NYE58235.1 hypothetical protein [Carboxydothermus ferrireducens DSM 11255]
MPKKAKKNFELTPEHRQFMFELANEVGVDVNKVILKTKNTENVNIKPVED